MSHNSRATLKNTYIGYNKSLRKMMNNKINEKANIVPLSIKHLFRQFKLYAINHYVSYFTNTSPG